MIKRLPPSFGAPLLVLLACSCRTGEAANASDAVTVYSSADSELAAPVLRAFERQSGVRVRIEYRTDSALEAAFADPAQPTDRPRADVVWFRDPVGAAYFVRRGLLVPFVPPSSATIPVQFKSPKGLWTGFGAFGRVLLVNTRQVPESQRPRSVLALSDPQWQGRIAMAGPGAGSARLHVASWMTLWGSDSTTAFLRAMKRNGVRFARSDRDVARMVLNGSVAFGLLDTDEASNALRTGGEVAVIYPDQKGMGTLLIPMVVVLLKGAENGAAARRLIDYVVSDESEQRIAQIEARVPLGSSYSHTPGLLAIEQIHPMSVSYELLASQVDRVAEVRDAARAP